MHARNATSQALATSQDGVGENIGEQAVMCCSTEVAKRGYARLTYDGTDEQFQLMSPADGGFLGRPMGWER